MRQIITTLSLSLLVAAPAAAQLNQLADGYYRVQNTATKRYATLYDDKGKINKVATSVDAGAIRTYYGFDRVVSDPASVIYFKKAAAGYELHAQGTNTAAIMSNYYLQLRFNGTSYQAYGQQSGYTIYLSDERLYKDSQGTGKATYNEKYDSLGYMTTGGQNYKYWLIKPVDASTDNYFGFAPQLKAGSSYYQSFYAEFPFSFVSSETKAYYVSARNDHKAVARLSSVDGGEVPAATPVIICSNSSEASSNRINLLKTSAPKLADNLLIGVYFCSSDELLPWFDQLAGAHENYVLNNPATMRVLAVENDELVLKQVDWKYIPRNSFYMKVPAGAPATYRLLLPDAYATGINAMSVPETNRSSAVYTLSGQRVSDGDTSRLPAGIYVRGGKKIVVR